MQKIVIKNTQVNSREIKTESALLTKRSYKLQILVDALRIVANDQDIKNDITYIPNNCEKYGFAEGYHNLGTLFHFLADMIEE